MRQILSSWNLLPPQKQLVLVLAILATVVTMFGLVKLATKPQMALLYSGLDAGATSEIVTAIDKQAIPYEVRGDAIYIDSSQRDQARLSLASEGLPANGIAGYELLDSLSGFGTTSQMFDAAYWRAKEGELARTILASARIKMARVHIANTASRPFERDVKPTASVSVTTKSGPLDTTQAEAIRYLVAAAVAGLAPEQVTVIDTNYGVILQPGEAATRAAAGELDGRADALRANVERLLTARVGPGNAIVEVMVEPLTASEVTTERILDPNGRVPVSSDSETDTENSTGGAGGDVTVASNLPDTGASAGGTSTRNQSRTRERINYDISETVRESTRQPGDIARLSVAVLVNGETTTDANGNTVYTPRSAEELAAFKALVQSAVGFTESRGDVVTIETMQFPAPAEVGTVATAGMFSNFVLNIPMLIQMALLGLVAIVIGMFVIRPILLNPMPEIPRLPADDLDGLQNDPAVIDGAAVQTPAGTLSDANPDPVDILRETIAKRADESGHLLRNWIESEPVNQKEQVS